jgi:hypothetical protein
MGGSVGLGWLVSCRIVLAGLKRPEEASLVVSK